MPWLFYRYILGELIRVFLLSGGVLVTVIAFGAAIKPLAADTLFGPAQTAKFIAFATVPMLQFALPFAAGFAATIVFHRLTKDNEIQAASASGISYQRILMPIFVFGILLVAIMVGLTQYVIPQFLAKMEQSISVDITQIFRKSIEKGVPYQIGDIQIYADKIYEQPNPETGAQTRLILIGVAAAELDDLGRITTDVTASTAIVDFHLQGNHRYIQLELRDTVAYIPKKGELLAAPVMPIEPILIPSIAHDEPEFMTLSEMHDLQDDPGQFSEVIKAKNELAKALREIEVWQQIREKLKTQGQIKLIGELRTITVKAHEVIKGVFSNPENEPITVQVTEQSGVVVLFSANEVSIASDDGSSLALPSFELVLEDCDILDVSTGEVVNQRALAEYGALEVADLKETKLAAQPYRYLLEKALGANGNVVAKAEILNQRVDDLLLQINSKIQRRYALSGTAILLLLLGATLAMMLRQALPLVIYACAFVPSILDIIMISGGGHMVRDGNVVSGTIVLWSGNVLLIAIIIGALRRVMRN